MILQLDNLSVRRRDSVILKDISVSFPKGLTYVVGLNGSGKTTLLKCLAQLIPYQGSIWLDKFPLHRLAPRDLARKLAVVPQHLNIPVRVRVYDFILMGRFPYLNWLGNYRADDHERVGAYLKSLDISTLADRYLDEISGGELQKVCIARALCQDTPVLLLDEPGQSLDPKNKIQLYRQLESLAQQGKTLICATHDLDPLENPEARIIGIREGVVKVNTVGGAIRPLLMEKVYGYMN